MQISMTAPTIPVKTTGFARTLLVNTTAAVQQDLLENNVKKVTSSTMPVDQGLLKETSQ